MVLRRQVSCLDRAQSSIVDVSDGFADERTNEAVLVIQKVCLVVILQRLLQVEHQVVREAQRHQRLAVFGIDSQALFISLNG